MSLPDRIVCLHEEGTCCELERLNVGSSSKLITELLELGNERVGGEDHKINQANRCAQLRMCCRQLQCNDATHAVSNKNRSFHAEFSAKPCQVICESGYRILPLWCIAGAVSAKISSYHPLKAAEVLSLWREEIVIASPSMHE